MGDWLQANWSWIMVKPFSFFGAVVAAFVAGCGLAWTVLDKFYSVRAQHRSSGSKSVPSAYAYPQHGKYGPSILAQGNPPLKAGVYYSACAEIPANGALVARISGEPGTPSWAVSVGSSKNWDRQDWIDTPSGVKQDYVANEAGGADMKIKFDRAGIYVVELFESHTGIATHCRTLRVID